MSNISSALRKNFLVLCGTPSSSSKLLLPCEACDGAGYVYSFAYLRNEAQPNPKLALRTCRLCLGKLPQQIDIAYPNPSISSGFKTFADTVDSHGNLSPANSDCVKSPVDVSCSWCRGKQCAGCNKTGRVPICRYCATPLLFNNNS